MKRETTSIIIAVALMLIMGIISYLLVTNQIGDNASNNQINKGKEVHFTEIKKGITNDITQKQTRIIKSSESWSDLWTEMFPTEMIASAINFNESMVVAVFQGQKSTGGYDIKINKIVETSNKLLVYITETPPGKNCIVTQALTQPYNIIQLKHSEKPIEFIFEQKINECD
ncbi:protease complex subunit PrcB family protein [Candidatus Pacearchaeota archaeon]|nr:protease complex subunit PrcB family protein [Candidatus Pacearchaeota archaeon]